MDAATGQVKRRSKIGSPWIKGRKGQITYHRTGQSPRPWDTLKGSPSPGSP